MTTNKSGAMNMLKEKIEKKFEFDKNCEAAFRYYADCNSDRLLESRDNFNEGRRYERFHLKSEVLPILLECVERIQDTQSWLKRMNELKWEDEGFAPNFKYSINKNDEALERLRKWSEGEN